ncbi:MAG: DUF4160 domain-containing protein [Alphaproteobacteria bacterium]|nr:DUF4160 domain-containing protein [Alphaproteobacteria bacterium]
MPTISFFYGIAIRMYFRDHAPPHFHAVYGEYEAFISIETGEILAGHLPKTATRLVAQWALARRAELRANWQRALNSQPLERLAGLEDE